jgi:diaminopimelate decarboxylase
VQRAESEREVNGPWHASGSETGIAAAVAVRVNPDFELKGSGMRMGGGAKQFGVDAEDVPRCWRPAELGLDVLGFHIFSGSQSLKAEAIVRGAGPDHRAGAAPGRCQRRTRCAC